MEVCPVGFFCFDRNTFTLVVLTAIIFIVYHIHSNNNKLENNKQSLENKENQFNLLTQQLNQTQEQIKDLKNNNLTIERNQQLHNHNSEEIYLVNKDHERVINPLMPPERSYPYRINRVGIPINIPTRGESGHYQQVGALYMEGESNSEKKILPLFGKPTYPGSRQWLYYTGTDNFPSVKLPVENKSRSCQGDHGCQEITEGDQVKVTGYNGEFKVSVYQLDKPRYLPHVF
jgi:hypothetical protein